MFPTPWTSESACRCHMSLIVALSVTPPALHSVVFYVILHSKSMSISIVLRGPHPHPTDPMHFVRAMTTTPRAPREHNKCVDDDDDACLRLLYAKKTYAFASTFNILDTHTREHSRLVPRDSYVRKPLTLYSLVPFTSVGQLCFGFRPVRAPSGRQISAAPQSTKHHRPSTRHLTVRAPRIQVIHALNRKPRAHAHTHLSESASARVFRRKLRHIHNLYREAASRWLAGWRTKFHLDQFVCARMRHAIENYCKYEKRDRAQTRARALRKYGRN